MAMPQERTARLFGQPLPLLLHPQTEPVQPLMEDQQRQAPLPAAQAGRLHEEHQALGQRDSSLVRGGI